MSQTKKIINILPTRGFVVLPQTSITISVGREYSVAAVNDALQDGNQIIVVSQKNKIVDVPKKNDLFKIGTLCQLHINYKDNDGVFSITLKGLEKVRIDKLNETKKGYYNCEYEVIQDVNDLTATDLQTLENIIALYYNAIIQHEHFQDFTISDFFNNATTKLSIINWLPVLLELDYDFLQLLLELNSYQSKLQKLLVKLASNDYLKKIDKTLNNNMNANLSKQQKEYYLREKIRVIKEELGDISSKENEVEEIKNKLKKNPYPDNIKKKILRELNHMRAFNNPNEYTVSKTYVDWLLDLPYWQKHKEVNDLLAVEKTLNQNHYGLEKIKERIIEYLAVKMKSPKIKGSIICLVGPPGVGKTSLVESIAVALNKKFVKISLGGMRDDSELKGHRKTYIGAMPGRVIKAMVKAKVINPVFLLDEIDKIASDHRGDPASTLLEILDPEQNHRFSDNYIEEEYDLSNVLFIATANYEDNIPEPLKDRLEIIRLSSYTENEKLAIAQDYLVKKILLETNLKPEELRFEDSALEYIIKRYTREAGVREVERCIRQIIRKFVVRQQKEGLLQQVIDIAAVRFYLKKEIYDYTTKDRESIPGVVNGMAYTSFGGDLLPIEANFSKGKGKVNITGNLRETMKESVNVAIGYIKANAEKFGIDPAVFGQIDLHIHVPSGGVPKDGPSAGIALTTAILSALKRVKIPSNVAMTGEITLRGKVLVIGGVKEKTISAFRGGANNIFMPKDDERYLEDVPNEVLEKITITFVENYEDVYKHLF